jgi:hypothetical protein
VSPTVSGKKSYSLSSLRVASSSEFIPKLAALPRLGETNAPLRVLLPPALTRFGSPVPSTVPWSTPCAHRVSHPFGGLLLPNPSSLISCRWHSWDFATAPQLSSSSFDQQGLPHLRGVPSKAFSPNTLGAFDSPFLSCAWEQRPLPKKRPLGPGTTESYTCPARDFTREECPSLPEVFG